MNNRKRMKYKNKSKGFNNLLILCAVILVVASIAGISSIANVDVDVDSTEGDEFMSVDSKVQVQRRDTEDEKSVNDDEIQLTAEEMAFLSLAESEMELESQVDMDSALQDIPKEELDSLDAEAVKGKLNRVKIYKLFLEECELTKEDRKAIEHMFKKYPFEDILTVYTFIEDRYGTLEDVSAILKAKKKKNTYGELFEAYELARGLFVPSQFGASYLEDLLLVYNVAPDEIMMADQISFYYNVTFQEVIQRVIDGESMEDIKESFGILNNEEAFERIAIAESELSQYISTTDLSQDMIIGSMAIAAKYEANETEIMDLVKSGIDLYEIEAMLIQAMYQGE